MFVLPATDTAHQASSVTAESMEKSVAQTRRDMKLEVAQSLGYEGSTEDIINHYNSVKAYQTQAGIVDNNGDLRCTILKANRQQ
jgi:hypothetical protein